MIISLIATFAPFLLKFLGGGVIKTWLDHNKEMAETANVKEKNKYEYNIQLAENALEVKKNQRQAQVDDAKGAPWVGRAKGMLVFAVCLYWTVRIVGRLIGISDFSIVVEELSDPENIVSMMVLGYLFVDDVVKRVKA